MSEMEKLNIRIPSAVKQRLDDDATLFEITKENGEINRNEFLNRIIDGYYPQYDENNARLEKNIRDIIGDDLKASEVMDCVLKEIQGYQMNTSIKNNCTISYKPWTRLSRSIDRILTKNQTTDAHPRNLLPIFTSYLNNPLYIREQYIFKDSLALLSTACDNHSQISITLKSSPKISHSILPHKLSVGNERFNYLLCQEWDAHQQKMVPRTFRLNRINPDICYEAKTLEPSLLVQSLLDKMDLLNPAYLMKEKERIVIEMGAKAKVDYRKITFDRPQFVNVEGNRFIFDCSTSHAYKYFRGLDGIKVIAPEILSKNLIAFHRHALEILE